MCGVCVVGGGVGAHHGSFPLSHSNHSSGWCRGSERNPAITHPSLFLFSCLNSNHWEFPYCCGKACVCVYLCELAYSTVLSARSPHSIAHTHTFRGFSSKSRKKGNPRDTTADAKSNWGQAEKRARTLTFKEQLTSQLSWKYTFCLATFSDHMFKRSH